MSCRSPLAHLTAMATGSPIATNEPEELILPTRRPPARIALVRGWIPIEIGCPIRMRQFIGRTLRTRTRTEMVSPTAKRSLAGPIQTQYHAQGMRSVRAAQAQALPTRPLQAANVVLRIPRQVLDRQRSATEYCTDHYQVADSVQVLYDWRS